MSGSSLQRITVEPGKCGGRPCIRGKRISVTQVLQLLADELSIEDVLGDYPSLERDDIRAAILCAARQTSHEVISVG